MEIRKKLEKESRLVAILAGILFWLAVVALVLRAVYTVYAAITPGGQYTMEQLPNGNWRIEIADNPWKIPVSFSDGIGVDRLTCVAYTPDADWTNPDAKATHMILLGRDFLIHAGVVYVLYLLRRMLSEIALGETPFSRRYGAYVRRIAYVVMALLVVPQFISQRLMNRVVLAALAQNRVSWHYTEPHNLAWFLIGLMILLLARILDYGALLQQESDETL